MSQLDAVLARIDDDLDAALERLFAVLRIKSISTDPAFAGDCRACADWHVADLASIGFEASARETPGHPIVVGHDRSSPGPSALFYGHYDVQPVDPLNLWGHDPFAPFIETRPDGTRAIRARGASDDKGQLMTFVEACRAWKAVAGRLPIAVSILLEGEEESGGVNLPPFLRANADELRADIGLICDTNMWDAATPAIQTMLRGLCGEEIVIRAADRDLHSGFYGSAAANPNHVLARILADLRDADGRVTLPGFYDGVPELPAALREQWEALPFDPAAFLGAVGLSVPAGERGRSVLEMTWSRPTCEINGMGGGYQGEGFKTVIPAEASAKISFRLVFDQDPHKARAAFRDFVRARVPADCKVEFTEHGAGSAIRFPIDAPGFGKTRDALSAEWGREAFFIGGGGSIPVTHGEASPRLVLTTLFALTAILGLFISNTATAVLMAPVALAVAADLGASPYPFAMIVALAASTAFMTPVSSPVNTLVVVPGGYLFGDFVRIGLPFSVLVLIVSVALVPTLLPLK